MTVEVGVRELRANLGAYLDRVQAGEDIVVTKRGEAVARIMPPGARSVLDELIARGVVTAPTRPKRPIQTGGLPTPRGGTVTDLLIEQRRASR